MQKVFQGGSVGDLHRMLNIEDASTVLYVGDHIYGDILKSKKAMGWRTMVCHALLRASRAFHCVCFFQGACCTATFLIRHHNWGAYGNTNMTAARCSAADCARAGNGAQACLTMSHRTA